MHPPQNQRTIVRHTRQLAAYPFQRLDSQLQTIFLDALITGKVVDPERFSISGLLKLLDCFLAISTQRLSVEELASPNSVRLFESFLGALGCTAFFDKSPFTAQSYQYAFRGALAQIKKTIPELVLPTGDDKVWLEAWEKTEVDPKQVEFWSGWWVRGKSGDEVFFNLVSLRDAYGADIAQRTHASLATYWQGREVASLKNSMPLFVQFFSFLCDSKNFPLALQDGGELSIAIFAFCEHFFTRAHESGFNIDVSVKRWNDWRKVAQRALIEPQTWPRPNPPIPAPPHRDIAGAKTYLRKNANGAIVREKLLTDVPLEILDDDVIELLFGEVTADVGTVVNWATERANLLYRQSQNRKKLAEKGLAYDGGHTKHSLRQIGVENLAATFEVLGMAMFELEGYQPRVGACGARELEESLGLPGTYDLEPFMYLLINEHPKITDSFLRDLMVFDKHGHFVGFEKTDVGHTLVGYKRRRGGGLAEQRIELTKRGEVLIEQVLQITRPLRDWLKLKNNDDWRYLFLSTAKGLRKPSRVTHRFRATAKYRDGRLSQLEPYTSKRAGELQRLVERMSLTSFRASRGVCVYLETKSVQEMARALGHAKYTPGLLSHYLPEPILSFFRSRWIRIFQTSLICEALSDSPHLLRAADFKSMDQLHVFLKNHAFRDIPAHLQADSAEMRSDGDLQDRRAYVNAGVGVLTALISLQGAVAGSVRPVNGKARYWADYADAVVNEVSRASHDFKLLENLRVAREYATPDLFRDFVHA